MACEDEKLRMLFYIYIEYRKALILASELTRPAAVRGTVRGLSSNGYLDAYTHG